MRTGEGIELRWEAMLRGIHMQADWLRRGPAELLEEARGLLHEAPPRIYLTGCGDSHFAGIGARLAFERWSGIPTQAVESLELSRYELELAPWPCVSSRICSMRGAIACVNCGDCGSGRSSGM